MACNARERRDGDGFCIKGSGGEEGLCEENDEDPSVHFYPSAFSGGVIYNHRTAPAQTLPPVLFINMITLI
jgi:hypothetical protein